MSDYESVAVWCEHNPNHSRRDAPAAIWFPTSIAYYPQDLVELGIALTRAALEQDGAL